jgi:hypothetical protein
MAIHDESTPEKQETIKGKITTVLLSGQFTDYSDVVKKAGGGSEDYVQTIKRELEEKQLLPRTDRRSLRGSPILSQTASSGANKMIEPASLRTTDDHVATGKSHKSVEQTRADYLKAVAMIKGGQHNEVEIMQQCDLLIPEYLDIKKQIAMLDNYERFVDA